MSVRWSPFVKTVVTIGLLLFGIWLIGQFHALLGPLVTTALVIYLLNLPVAWLIRRTGLPRTSATILVFLAVVLLIVLLPALIGPRLVAQAAALEFDLQAVQTALERFAAQPIELFTLRIEPQNLLDQLMASLAGIASPVAASAFVLVANAAEAIGWLIFVLIVAFLVINDLHYFTRLISERIPASIAPDFYRLGQELDDIWNAFLRGQLVISLIMTVLTSIALAIVGMRSALVLGTMTGIFTLIPSIGPILAAAPALLLALVRGSSYLPVSNPVFAFIIAGIYILVFQFENLYLHPVILGRRVRLHPAVVIVATIGGALTAGVLGVFLAAPVIASARLLLGYTLRKLLDQEPFDQPQESPQTLGVQWRGLIRGRAVGAVLFDLDGTLMETDDRAVERIAQHIARFHRFLPGRDPQRVARRIVMWAYDWSSRVLTLLDLLHLDAPVQRLARRLGLLEETTSDRALEPVAGVVSLIFQLNGRYPLGIVSTRHEAEIRAYLDRHGLSEQIRVIAGADTTERIKPHPQPILWAAQQLHVQPAQVAVVGDTPADIQAAKAAGALAVGVLCGFGERDDLAQADLILESTADLAEWL